MLAGSPSDKPHVDRICNELAAEGIFSIPYFASAHKNPNRVLELLAFFDAQRRNRRIVYVAVAGMSNALSGVVAANCSSPVIACPPFKDLTDMQTNVQSSLQMPRDVPGVVCLHPKNVAQFCKRMFTL